MLRRLISEDIIIKTILDPKLLTITADQITIKQVILNLALNAQDAMPEGGKLIIKTENYVLDENENKKTFEAKPGKYVSISVIDSGIGIDQDTIHHIFDPFFTTKEIGNGSGMGLSVVHGIVKQHYGWLTVNSKPDKGTTFKIYLPAHSEKIQEPSKKQIIKKISKGKEERILVVEDDEIILKYVTKTLIKNGYKILSAKNSIQALKIFKKVYGDIDLLFSDVILPGGSGVKLVEKLLKLKPNLPVLLSSGYSDPKSQLTCIQKKGYRYIEKPYKISDLLKTIREVMHP